MAPTTGEEERFARAERLLAEYLEQRARGGGIDFAAFAARHPELATELRELYAAMGDVDDGLLRGQQAFAAQQAQIRATLDELRSANDSRHRYVIESELGKGGMGAVFRVRDTALERPLAMKVILGQFDATRSGRTPPLAPRQLKRFLNEAKITGQLDHPGIVPVHELGVDGEGRAYFTMKLVKGRNLGEIFRLQASGDPQWTRPRVLSVIQRVCEALAYAHERGVIHRDLKPANVMVGDFGEVYLMDWGLARRMGDSAERLEPGAVPEPDPLADEPSQTKEGAVLGTPAYMPPEQARGELAQMGPHSDVYAVGAMLYQLIAGYAPYCEPGKDTSLPAVIFRIGHEPPKELVRRDAPPDLTAICTRAMARDPRERYTSVEELGSDLRALLEGRVVRAFEQGAFAELKKWIVRNKALAATGASAFLASVALSGWALKERNVARANETRALHLAEVARDATLDLVEGVEKNVPRSTSTRLRNLRLDLLGSARSRLVQLVQETDLAGVRQIGARTNLLLADLSRETGRAEEAREYATRALRETDVEDEAWSKSERLTSRARALATLADLDREAGSYASAREHYEEALTDARAAGAVAEELLVLEHLSNLLLLVHEPDMARALRSEWIDLGEALVRREPESSEMRLLSARLYTVRGKWARTEQTADEALELLRKGKTILDTLYAESPDDPEMASSYASNLRILGDLLETRGALEEGLEVLGRGREVCEAYLEGDPESVDVRADLARVLTWIGFLHHQAGEVDEALAAYSTARDLRDRLVAQDVNQVEWLRECGDGLGGLAMARLAAGETEAGIQSLEEAALLAERRWELAPESADAPSHAAQMWDFAAQYRLTLTDHRGARECLQRALDLYQGLVRAFPMLAEEYRRPTRMVLRSLRHLDGALDEVLEIDLSEIEWHRGTLEGSYESHFGLSVALYTAGLTAWELERWDLAEDLLLEGLDEAERAHELPGGSGASMRQSVASMSLRISLFFLAQGKLHEHAELADQAMQRSKAFVDRNAEIREWRAQLEAALESDPVTPVNAGAEQEKDR